MYHPYVPITALSPSLTPFTWLTLSVYLSLNASLSLICNLSRYDYIKKWHIHAVFLKIFAYNNLRLFILLII
jgi:hypothetical protein